jgi:fimbrial chaperone protein
MLSQSLMTGAFRSPALLLAALALAPAQASTLQVDPVKVEITAGRKTGAVRIRNAGNAPVTIRGYARRWTQQNGRDQFGDAAGVIVSPPVATIAPGRSQLVRVGLRTPPAAAATYRFIVEEVPEPRPGGGAVQVALRLDMPMFVLASQGPATQLKWAAWQRPDRRWVLEAANPGAEYVRVTPADVAGAGLRPDGAAPLGVVLPGGSRQWILAKAPTVADRARFDAVVRAHGHDDPTRLAANH